ncbi:MAG: hypothetical protein D6730_10260 [Bacteroidetes bacterium]|nr:MAG: hypothetical protein D6730_10260 [Bacteroidota bacterium]
MSLLTASSRDSLQYSGLKPRGQGACFARPGSLARPPNRYLCLSMLFALKLLLYTENLSLFLKIF